MKMRGFRARVLAMEDADSLAFIVPGSSCGGHRQSNIRGAGGSGKQRWSKDETLMLIEAKRQHADGILSSEKVSSSAHKWKAISECLRGRGVDRDVVACKKRWFNLMAEYTKIRIWQRLPAAGCFWLMQPEMRRENRLPSSFDQDVFRELDSWLGHRSAILDKGVISTEPNVDSVASDIDAPQDLLEKGCNAAPSESDNLKGLDSKSRKKRKESPDETDMTNNLADMVGDVDLQNRLVQVLEKNGQGIEAALRESCQAQIDAQKEISAAQVEAQKQMLEVQKDFVGAMYAMVNVLGELAKSLQK